MRSARCWRCAGGRIHLEWVRVLGSAGSKLGRVARALLWLAALTLALWLAESAVSTLQPFLRLTQGLLLVLGGLVLTHRLILLARRVLSKLLWRVRHRMLAVYFFVGVLPISLAALIVAWGTILLFGPLTAYMITTSMERQAGRIEAVAAPLLWQLQRLPAAERSELARQYYAEAQEDLPELILYTEIDGVRASYPDGAVNGPGPAEIPAHGGMVRMDDAMYLATVARDDSTGGRVIAAVALTQELMASLMPGLGILDGGEFIRRLHVRARAPEAPPPAAPTGAPVVVKGMPLPANPFDWQINWPIQTSFVDWDSGEQIAATYILRTRPWALWSQIFSQETAATFDIFTILGWGLLGTFGINILLSLFIAASLTRTLTRAVNDLYVGTTYVNRGDFGYRIPVSGSDQVSELSRSFNTMTASIELLIEESKRRQQLEAELEIAREVQSRLFPASAPEFSGLEVLGVCRPARSVSGDFFDYVSLAGGRLAISFGDVSGKGISAALVMASLHSILRMQLALLHPDQSQAPEHATSLVVEQANLQLCLNTAPDKFSTLFFGVYDASASTLTYSNAGHLPPLLLRNGEITPLDVNGMIVGAFEHADYSATKLAMEPGDLLVAYTDGITEPENSAGDEFGEDRLQQAIRRDSGQPLQTLIDNVLNDVVAWTGESTLQDDMTMLAVRKL